MFESNNREKAKYKLNERVFKWNELFEFLTTNHQFN